MALFDNVAHLLPGLLPGAYRGVGFDAPDARSEMGRRVAEHLFPGMDRAAYDDLGLLPEVFSIEGVILGDDYIARAKALAAVFQRPGTGTLFHPWLGPMRVIVDRPPEISFSARELRLARFSAYFKRVSTTTGPQGGLASAASLANAALSAVDLALSLIGSAERLSISRTRILASTRTGRIIATALGDATVDRAGARRLATSFAALGLPGSPLALAAAIADAGETLFAAVPALTSGPVAPAAEASSKAGAALSPVDGFSIALDAANALTLAVSAAPSPSDRAMLAAAASAFFGFGGRVLSGVAYPTRREATATRAAIAASGAEIVEALGDLGETAFGAPAVETARAVSDLRQAAIADINEIVGRLPQVVALNTDRPTDAFLVAHHLFGDTPSAVEAAYEDIVARNRPRHPAQLPAGRIEAAR